MTVSSPLMTAAEAGAYLRKSRAWVSRHADEIGCVRDGGRLHFRIARLDAWISSHEVGGAPLRLVEPRRMKALSVGALAGQINRLSGLPVGSVEAVLS